MLSESVGRGMCHTERQQRMRVQELMRRRPQYGSRSSDAAGRVRPRRALQKVREAAQSADRPTAGICGEPRTTTLWIDRANTSKRVTAFFESTPQSQCSCDDERQKQQDQSQRQ